MSDPRVAVALVNYNSGKLICQCLETLVESSIELNVIVIDNLSTDQSLQEVCNRFGQHPWVRIIRNQHNVGFSTAVNLAFKNVSEEYLLLVNPDCLVPADAIASLVRVLGDTSDAGIAGGLVLNMDGTEQRGCRRREPTPLRSIGRVIQPMASLFKIRTNHIDMANLPIGEPVQSVDAVSGAFLMIRRELFECLEGMDQDYFLHWEDFDLCRRCRDVGKAVLFSADAVVIHHKSASGGVSSHQVESLKNHSMLRYFRKFYPASCRFGLIQTLWLAALLRRYAIKLSTQLRRRPDSGVASLSNSFSYPKLRSDSVVVVTGASSQIGDFLLPQLQQLPDTIIAISRGSRAGMVEGNVWWVKPDLVEHLAKIISCKQLTWYHLAPVWIADQFSRKLVKAGLSRVVGVSSSSVLTKSNSGDSIETGIVAKLLDGENHLMCLAEKSSINVTLFRPSMVYGNNNNKNIATIKKLIRYFRCYPLVGVAAGKRQPINAHDIADSCLKVHSCAAAFGKIYILAGGEVLTYRQMIERVFQSMGIKPRFLILPTGLLRMLLKVFSSLPGGGFLSPEMADRMQKDLLFDIKTAKQDFDFCPSDFRLK